MNTENSVMSEKEKSIDQSFKDIQEWMITLQKQFNESRQLSDPQSKLLFAVRDLAKGIKPVTAPAPPPAPKPPFNYMEAPAKELFQRLDNKRDSMTPEHRHAYNQLRNLFEADGHTGVSLPWDAMDFLRRCYGTYFFSRR